MRQKKYLQLGHLSDKTGGTEDDFNIHCAICRDDTLVGANHKCSIGPQHGDLVLKINGHIAGQADTLGVCFSHSTLAEADASWEPGLIHHWVGMDGNEHVLTLCQAQPKQGSRCMVIDF